MKKSLLLFTVLLILVSGVSFSQVGYPDMDKMRIQIQTMNLKFADGVTKKDASAFMDMYTDNAKILVPDEEFIMGNDKVRQWWDTYLKGDIHSISLNTVSLSGDNDVIYETGQVIREIWKNDKASMQYDKYLTIWRQQDDGSYKIAVSCWNLDKKMDW